MHKKGKSRVLAGCLDGYFSLRRMFFLVRADAQTLFSPLDDVLCVFFFFFCCRCETAQITQLLWHHVVTISSEWIIPSKETWRRGEEVGGSDLLVMKNWNNKGAEVLNKEMRATACRDLLLLFWEHTQVYRETLTNRVVHLPARLLKSNEGVKGESLDEALRGGSK